MGKLFKSKKKKSDYSSLPTSEEAAIAAEEGSAATSSNANEEDVNGQLDAPAAPEVDNAADATQVDMEANLATEDEPLLPPSPSPPAAEESKNYLRWIHYLRNNVGAILAAWLYSIRGIPKKVVVVMLPILVIPLIVLSLAGFFPAGGAASVSSYKPANDGKLHPPVLPLVVRNPYFSTWLGHAREAPWSNWPIFWRGQEVGMSVMIRVKKYNTVYPLLGKPHDSIQPSRSASGFKVNFPIYNGPSFDGSVTNLTYTIRPDGDKEDDSLRVILSFSSPVTVNDTMRQSIPASYLNVHVSGNLEASVYMDLNGDWVTGLRDSDIMWEFHASLRLKTWSMKRTNEDVFHEYKDRAEWGTLYFTADVDSSHQSGDARKTRMNFAKNGALDNSTDSKFRKVMDKEPVIAFSKDFGGSTVSMKGEDGQYSDSTLFTLAHIQDPVVQFASARGLTHMRPLWNSYFTTVPELLHFHYLDFPTITEMAAPLSQEILSHSSRAMSKEQASTYAGILLLSARQILGATQFSGTPDRPIIFLKEISSNGNFQTVDVIFPSFPFFLWANPKWLRYLLEPLLEHQAAGLYPNDYSMHDMGKHFPNATGHPDGKDEYMPVEECGNMLIMAASAVGSIIDEYGGGEKGRAKAREWIEGKWGENGSEASRYTLWKKWTKYLVDFSLMPETQLCTDDFAGQLANQTNLALKGIIGIKAMAQIAGVVGEQADEYYYHDIANSYIKDWEKFAVSHDGKHTKLAYHWQGSWGTLYNLYADALLCLRSDTPDNSLSSLSTLPKHILHGGGGGGGNPSGKKQSFVPKRIYKMQSEWYAAVEQKYGLPLDSRHLYTKSDWEFFAAAVAERDTRELIVRDVGKWVSETSTDRPFTDLYDTEGTGGWPGFYFMARPVVGGHFAVLALEKSCSGEGLKGFGYYDDEKEDGKKVVVEKEEDGKGGMEADILMNDDEKRREQHVFGKPEEESVMDQL